MNTLVISTSMYIGIFLFCSCKESEIQKFVNVYGEEQFNDFKNKSISIRSVNQENSIILFISNDLQNAAVKGPYIVEVDQKYDTIKSTDSHLVSNDDELDTLELKNLALKFLKYRVNKLGMDNTGTVYVGVKSNEQPDLIRFSDLKFKTEIYAKWKLVQKNWYSVP